MPDVAQLEHSAKSMIRSVAFRLSGANVRFGAISASSDAIGGGEGFHEKEE